MATIVGTVGDDSLEGGAGDDRLEGLSGADTLWGGPGGLDTLEGGGGDDVYQVDDDADGLDVVVEDADAGIDTVRYVGGTGYTLGAEIEHLVAGGVDVDLALAGNALANALTGGGGDDTLSGLAGDDSIAGGAGKDQAFGGDGDDTLDGADGWDTLAGGAGDDTYIVGESDAEWVELPDGGWIPVWSETTVVEAAGDGIDTVVDAGLGHALAENVENYVGQNGFGNGLGNEMTALGPIDTGWGLRPRDSWLSGGGGDDTLNGGGGDDDLDGGDGDDVLSGDASGGPQFGDADTLDGGAGADTMTGGLGIDQYWVDDLADRVVEAATPAGAGPDDFYYSHRWDSVYWTGGGRYTLADGVEFLHLRGDGVDAVGSAAGDVIFSDKGSYSALLGDEPQGEVRIDGGGGDDTILGGYGRGDTLLGGDGNDAVTGGGGSDVVAGGSGTDWIVGDASWNDGGADSLAGGSGDDTLDGVSGSDSLSGEDGHDVIDAGLGDDVLDGGSGDDVLYGAWGNDTLAGGAGSDSVGGGEGADVVTDFVDGEDVILTAVDPSDLTIEQDGADTLITYAPGWTLRLVGVQSGPAFARATAGVVIDRDDFVTFRGGSDGDDTLRGTGEAERVSGAAGDDVLDGGRGDDTVDGGAGEDALSGGAGGDAVDGGLGADTLAGGAGVDTLSGGAGDDLYRVDGSDKVVERAASGVDTVTTGVGAVLGRNVENLDLADTIPATATTYGSGNGLDNLIDGSRGADILAGLGGGDVVSGGDGADRVFGDDGRDVLRGGGDGDRLDGGTGRDVLWGGAGDDVLRGGSEADVFRFRSLGEGRDRVADFDDLAGDLVDLSAIDANPQKAGDQSFRFVDDLGGGRAGAALLVARSSGSVLSLDADGDGVSDLRIRFDGAVTQDAGWML